ncbi:hypothetical protein LR48_Vigan10g255900 [Vigna angularis]|uniref:Uncharacterized protein n=1 Tax=Phaseolus angularis TaxID=3914 RepID=A0A0L9VP38_PHAAN|nr:hypothetical protein LR48_Vigan10g255900 [Vigna angularis]
MKPASTLTWRGRARAVWVREVKVERESESPRELEKGSSRERGPTDCLPECRRTTLKVVGGPQLLQPVPIHGRRSSDVGERTEDDVVFPPAQRTRQAMMCDILWQDSENFVDDGIQIEPFNLDKETEEGYFHAAANFVEYVRENEIKSALKSVPTNDVDEGMPDLSSKDIAVMMRRIANVLEPGETAIIGFLCGQGVVEFLAKAMVCRTCRSVNKMEGPTWLYLTEKQKSDGRNSLKVANGRQQHGNLAGNARGSTRTRLENLALKE